MTVTVYHERSKTIKIADLTMFQTCTHSKMVYCWVSSTHHNNYFYWYKSVNVLRNLNPCSWRILSYFQTITYFPILIFLNHAPFCLIMTYICIILFNHDLYPHFILHSLTPPQLLFLHQTPYHAPWLNIDFYFPLFHFSKSAQPNSPVFFSYKSWSFERWNLLQMPNQTLQTVGSCYQHLL